MRFELMRVLVALAVATVAILASPRPGSVIQIASAQPVPCDPCVLVAEHLDALGVGHPAACDPSVGHVRSPKIGLGFEYGTGWQASAHPVDGRAWSLGVEARARLGKALGLVARLDRSTGRDEARDDDGDGRDDASTGAVTRLAALAGASLMLTTPDRALVRFLQVDVLAGYLSTRSQSGEHGPAVALDLSYQLEVARLGVRTLQGFGGAADAGAVLVHLGFVIGAGPQFSYGVGCGTERRPEGSRWALALDVPVGGWSTELGAIVPGVGVEGALHLHHRVDALVRGDLLVFPGGDRDRSLHQSLLAGARFDVSPPSPTGTRTGLFGALLAGYAFAAAPSSSPVQSGPIVDLSLGWGAQASDGAAYLRLHGRLGVSPDNADLRAVFLSAGAELRLDRWRWRDRN